MIFNLLSSNIYSTVNILKYFFFFKKRILFSNILLLTLVATTAFAQVEYQPYSYQSYQKLNSFLYATHTREHTSLQPFFMADTMLHGQYDSLVIYRSGKEGVGCNRKLLNEHLIDYRKPGSTFYADILPNISFGRDFLGQQNTNSGSVGLQLGGTVGNRFQYYFSGFISGANFPNYLSTYINQVGVVPGQANADFSLNRKNGSNWSYITALISYSPTKYLNITVGRDKTFIGDGYRSLLLSDYSSPYPFLKLTGTLGNVRYMVMWNVMNDPAKTSQYGIDRKKFGVFHYLDWSVSNRLSVGFFENVIGFFTDDNGIKRGFDFNYINPIIFMKPINNSSDDPDKSLLGMTAKYKISNGVTAYGQFVLNEFHVNDFVSSNGAVDNKYGWQFGLRGTNMFKVKKLNFLLEMNNVRPYTYSARSAIENYSGNGEPLAHPWGANFREMVGLLNYSYKRFDLSGEIDLGLYGLDINGLNYGKDIFKLYTNPAQAFGNYIGQGLTTHMSYFEGKAAFLLNPKYNLRIELGAIIRTETNDQFSDKTAMITIGLRSSFKNWYNDISSYKTH